MPRQLTISAQSLISEIGTKKKTPLGGGLGSGVCAPIGAGGLEAGARHIHNRTNMTCEAANS